MRHFSLPVSDNKQLGESLIRGVGCISHQPCENIKGCRENSVNNLERDKALGDLWKNKRIYGKIRGCFLLVNNLPAKKVCLRGLRVGGNYVVNCDEDSGTKLFGLHYTSLKNVFKKRLLEAIQKNCFKEIKKKKKKKKVQSLIM